MGPRLNDRCPCKKRRGHRGTEGRQPGDDDGRDKMMRPQAQEHRGLTAGSRQRLETGLEPPAEPLGNQCHRRLELGLLASRPGHKKHLLF